LYHRPAKIFGTNVPYTICVFVTTLVITAITLRCIQMTSRANYVMNAIMGSSLVWFILLAIRALLTGAGEGALFSAKPFFNPQTFSFGEVIGATSLAVLSFIGFDGVTTLAADSKYPSSDIGRATVLVSLSGAGLFMTES